MAPHGSCSGLPAASSCLDTPRAEARLTGLWVRASGRAKSFKALYDEAPDAIDQLEEKARRRAVDGVLDYFSVKK
jgi:hypothetical protein